MSVIDTIMTDNVMAFVVLLLLCIPIFAFVLVPAVAIVVEDQQNNDFTGNISVGVPGQDGMPYGWLCVEASPHNLRANARYGWAINQRGICEWR
jgi:hypothetical protein